MKVATPFCGVTVNVPPSPVPLVRASVTELVALVTGFPLASSITTWTAGPIVAPTKACEGCTRKASFAAVGPPPPEVIVKLVLVAGVSPVLAADRVKVPALLTVRLLKVAMPFCGVTVSVPVRPGAPPVSEIVTGLVAFVTALPLPSSTTTWTAGVIVAWVAALVGCTENASFTAEGPPPPPGAVIVKLVLAAEVRLGLVAESV